MSDLARGVILALNAGSSSVKFAIFESEALERLAGGEIERIGSDEASLHVTSAIAPGADQRTPAEVPDAPAAIGLLISSLPEILAGREIAAIAYRALFLVLTPRSPRAILNGQALQSSVYNG